MAKVKKQQSLTTLEQFKERHFGKRGSKERDNLESGYEAFKIAKLVSLNAKR
jgi:hypothetical protein